MFDHRTRNQDQALIAKGIVADFRAPNVLRLGFAPLYVRYQDIVTSISTLATIMNEHIYLEETYQVRQTVT